MITGKSRVVAVFGFPVSHSLSPLMQNRAIELLGLNWAYLPFAVEPASMPSAVESIRALNMVGANITVPLKELAAPYLDEIDSTASKIGSVNTIVNRDGRLFGYSTDGDGLIWDLIDKCALPGIGGSALVLGAGGSARAVVSALVDAGLIVQIANRTRSRAEGLVNKLQAEVHVVDWNDKLGDLAANVDLIVNTTTIGMAGADHASPPLFPPESQSRALFYDLVYTPRETQLMLEAQACGMRTINGLGMLVRQGALSLSLWTGLSKNDLPVHEMELTLSYV
jgi:shikimate dehydrogenase